uniref:DDE Tnp4 domain-containing protein n=1 Tax=Brassica oleracea var. oleracea TaxID=109376 RepID=A0A0D3BY44_BRAOL
MGDEFDQRFEAAFDECFEDTYNNNVEDRANKHKKRAYIERNREAENVLFFQQRKDAVGRLGLSPIQKCTATICMLAYGSAADAADEYLRLGESTALSCVTNFTESVIHLFGDEYLRRPTQKDLQRLLDIGKIRGFPGMIGSIDCMHWEWKNCPTAWKGQYTRGSEKPTIVLEAVELQGSITWSTDTSMIWRTTSRTVYIQNGQHLSNLSHSLKVLKPKIQESTRKDVERAFGVLQARFAIVKNPAILWDKRQIGMVMRTCIILHNMIVENERNGYTQYDTSEFEEGTSTRSSNVDAPDTSEMPPNLGNMLLIRTHVRDRHLHERLKNDLIENIWNKFGNDEDE